MRGEGARVSAAQVTSTLSLKATYLLGDSMTTIEPIESALKSTLHSLSLVLSFHSSVQQLAVAPYAPHPPRQHTQQIQLDSAKFAAACATIEQRLVRSLRPAHR